MDAKRKEVRQWLIDSPLSLYNKIIKEAKLTPRQQRIAFLKFRKNMRNYQIAQSLNFCPETVRDDISDIHDKIWRLVVN